MRLAEHTGFQRVGLEDDDRFAGQFGLQHEDLAVDLSDLPVLPGRMGEDRLGELPGAVRSRSLQRGAVHDGLLPS